MNDPKEKMPSEEGEDMEEWNFSHEEYEIATSVDLVRVAERLGYTTKRVGRYYTLKEMDSMRIYNNRTWCRWSDMTGGDPIRFLETFGYMGREEAMEWLLDFAGYSREESRFANGQGREHYQQAQKKKRQEKEEKREFILPEKNHSYSRLYGYLLKERKLSKPIVDYFVRKHLIYESKKHHNIVFLGKDKEGNIRFASMRGTADALGFIFKGNVPGNDKEYGFNVVNEQSEEIKVFEGGIDLMSYMDYYKDFTSNKLALGMLSDGPLERFLKEHGHIRKISFCLDDDEPGRKAVIMLKDKYRELGYTVAIERSPLGEDWNDTIKESSKKAYICQGNKGIDDGKRSGKESLNNYRNGKEEQTYGKSI